MTLFRYLFLVALSIFITVPNNQCNASNKKETVILQLKWTHQFQFAGYYAAKEKGFYAKEGLEVIFKERDLGKGPVQPVLDGDAHYGVADAGLLLDRIKGRPIVLLMQIFQHSPHVFVSRKDSGIKSPYDMAGKKVMLDKKSSDSAPLVAMILETIGSLDKIKIIPQTMNINDFVSGNTDAMNVYVTDQPFLLKKKGIDINIINPQNYGIDFYGDNLFTSEKEITEHPERVEKIIRATIKGWEYALKNPEEIVDLILRKYRSKATRDQLLFEAKMTDLMILPDFTPIGSVTPHRYEQVAEIFIKTGLAEKTINLKEFIYKGSEAGGDIGLSSDHEVRLTAEEKVWLAEHPTIRVHNEKGWMPVNFHQDGRPKGFSIGYMNLLAEKLGFKVEYITGPTWNEFMEMTRKKELDVMLNIAQSREREEFLEFTEPYLEFAQALYVRKGTPLINSILDLYGKKFAIPKGFYFEDVFKKHPEIELVRVKDVQEAVLAVATGKADAMLDLMPAVNYIIEKLLVTNLQIGGELGIGEGRLIQLSIGVRKDWEIFRNILQKGIQSISREEIRELRNRWLEVSDGHAKTSLILTELTEEEKAWIAGHPRIRVNGDEWPPFVIKESSGEYSGISHDILKLAANLFGLEIEIVPGEWDQMLGMLKDRELDLAQDMILTPERLKTFIFTEPYIDTPNAIYVRDDIDTIKSIKDLNGKKVPVVRGFYIEEILAKKYPGIIQVPIGTPLEGIKMIASGEADAYVGALAVSQYIIQSNLIGGLKIVGYFDQMPLSLRFGFHKDNTILAGIMQKALGQISDAEKRDIVEKYISLTGKARRKTTVLLSESEEKWLDDHPVIRVHNEKAFPPYNYFEYGALRGLSIDYMNLLADKLGIKVEYITGPTWNEYLSMIKNKKLDVMLNIVKTEERQKYILYTEPYAVNPNAIVSSKEMRFEKIEELKGKTVALPKGFFTEEILARDYPQIKLLPAKNALESLKAVSFGKADAAICEMSVANHLINEHTLSSLEISGELDLGEPGYQKLRIGIRHDWPIFQSILTKAMAEVTRQEMNSIRQRWLIEVQAAEAKTAPMGKAISLTRLIVYGIAVFLILSLLVFIMIKTVKREDIALNFGLPRFRFFVLTGLGVFIIVVCFLGWFTLEQNRKQALMGLSDSLQVMLETAEDRLNFWVAERTTFMKLLGRDPELVSITKRLLSVSPTQKGLLESDALKSARLFFKDNEEIFSNIGFFIISPDHISIGSMRDTNVGTRNLISTQRPELLRRAFHGEVLFVPPMESDVHLEGEKKGNDRRKQGTKFFMGPIRDLDGQIIAVMTLRIDPVKDFSEVLQAFGMLKSGETYAFNRYGQLLSESRFNQELQRIGLIKEGQQSALNIEIRDPGVNMLDGKLPDIERSKQPLTNMVSHIIQSRSDMDKAGQRQGRSEIHIDTKTYRDYRGVPVFGAGLWSADMGMGLITEIDAKEAMASYSMTRMTVLGILGITLFLSVSAILFVLVLGEKASKALMRARDNLEEKVEERTRELQENQSRLAEAEERSRLLLDSVGEGIFGVDTEGCINFINPSALDMLGFQEEELIGKQVHPVIHHSYADGSLYPVTDCPMFKAFTEGTSHLIDDEVLWRKDETSFPVEYSSTPIEKEGRLIGAVITFRDITERKAAEERFAALLESAPDAMIVSNETGEMILANSQAEIVFGYSREELIGENIDMLVPVEIRDNHPQNRAKFYENPQRRSMGFRGDFYGTAKDGRNIPVDVGLSPIETDEGLLVVASIRDITERKKMEEALSMERERLQGLLDTSPIGVAFTAKDKIQFANPRFKEMFGAGVGDASPDLYVNKEDREVLIKKLAAEGKVENHELQFYNRDHEIRDMLVTFLSITYGNEKGILGWALDITDRKNAEKEIRERFEQLERFRRMAVGRELKMIELKKEINAYLEKGGLPEKYKIH